MSAVSKAPAVSVVMPMYNSQRFVRAAIESILRQTFRDFELIIVDDASTDDSVGIAAHFGLRDCRVRLMTRPHTGIVGALNDGIAEARAPLVARMDADDISLPQRLAMQVDFLSCHPHHVLVGTRVMLIDPDGLPICEFPSQLTHSEIDSAHVNLQWAVVHPSVLMRTRAVKELGGYRAKYETLEDLDLFLRLAEIGQIANLPNILLQYRQHFSSICFQMNARQSEIRERLYREMFERRRLAFFRRSEEFRAPPRTIVNSMRQWAWMALGAGYVSTARKHALATVRRRPLQLHSWRLMYCAFRGH